MSAEKDREPALSQVSTPAGAVFLSYASQDAEAAQRICEALRGAGIEVWFDQSELRGGDAWDHKIRQQIRDCALFIPVISANTASRHEGYFRLEWDLADQRTHRIARNTAFIVPASLDATPAASVDIPESFQRVQWTRLQGGETPAAFVERVRGLLSSAASSARAAVTPVFASTARPSAESVASTWRSKVGLWGTGAVLAVALASIAVDRFLSYRSSPPPTPLAVPTTQAAAPAPATTAAFSPPPHSIAVLPFVNMSGDKQQEYFSEGLTEELLNSLSRINELQVAARTSSFSFQGGHPDIATVAHKLNVGAVLEGSVRRSAHTLRVTAQLVNGVTGFHLWSQTYDRELGDVLRLQTEIATAVASALKVSLLSDATSKIEAGGTRNPASFDAYLRASNAYWHSRGEKDQQTAISEYSEAIRLDPGYALAYAGRSLTEGFYWATSTAAPRSLLDRTRSDARKAIDLAPTLAEAHIALAAVYDVKFQFAAANEEYERALALAPGNVRVLRDFGYFAFSVGRGDFGLTLIRRAVVLDPLNPTSYDYLGGVLQDLGRDAEAMAAFRHCEVLNPGACSFGMADSYYALGDYKSARSICEKAGPDSSDARDRLAMVYDKLGRHADAEAQLARKRAAEGDADPLGYVRIYAQWGDRAKALEWLNTAMRLHDYRLKFMKMDRLLDPLRQEPRFQAIERELKFPSN